MGLYPKLIGFIKNQECWLVIQTFWLDPVSMIHRDHSIIFKDRNWIQRVSLVFHLMKKIHWIMSSQSQSTFISSNQTQVLVIMTQNQYKKIHKVHNMFSNQLPTEVNKKTHEKLSKTNFSPLLEPMIGGTDLISSTSNVTWVPVLSKLLFQKRW